MAPSVSIDCIDFSQYQALILPTLKTLKRINHRNSTNVIFRKGIAVSNNKIKFYDEVFMDSSTVVYELKVLDQSYT